jgi:hypothetical protein
MSSGTCSPLLEESPDSDSNALQAARAQIVMGREAPGQALSQCPRRPIGE